MRRAPITLGVFLRGMWLASVLLLYPGPAAAAGPDVDRVLELTNAERESAGLAPLVLSPQLSDAAQNYSQVLAAGTCFDHTCGPVPDFAERLGQAGYTGWRAIAENIAAGYPTPEAVVAGWMASPGHRVNILSPDYREIGVGVVSGGRYGTYWTQEFGARPGVALNVAPPVLDDTAAAAAAASDEEP